MAYNVVKKFRDKETGDILFPGSVYDHADGKRISHLQELGFIDGKEDKKSSTVNYPKHTGGGYYELSNGEKVQGKDSAMKEENKLQGGD